jgi:PAS domain S-box-containing protein
LTLVNPRMSELIGYSGEELMSVPFVGFIHPDDRQMVMEIHQKRILGDHLPSRYSFRLVKKTGEIIWIEISAVVIEWDGLPGTLNFLMDVTERRHAEEALRESNKKLRLLTGLTRHDIFNQLATIELFQELALESSDLAKIHDYITHARTAENRIENIIGFTREYEDFGGVSSDFVPVSGIIESATNEVIPGSIQVINEIPPELQVYADPIIRKVFTTLLENAIRHGGITTEIRFLADRCAKDLVLVCEDDGTGIRQEEKEMIFEHGFGSHTGIGLFLAREILSITGLSIRECGTYGKGARFEILVPFGKYHVTGE